MVNRVRCVIVNDEVVEESLPRTERAPAPVPGAIAEGTLPHGGYVESNGRLISIGIYL